MASAAELTIPFPGRIEPTWWTGEYPIDPSVFTIDRGNQPLSESDLRSAGSLGQQMREIFDAVGLVYVRNTGLTDLQAMREVARHVIDQEMVYKGGANPRSKLEPNVYEVGAPLTAWLHYHHEMAYISRSTRMLGFLAHKAVPNKGATFVSDNVQATDALLATEFGQKLRELGLCYHRNLTDRDSFANRAPIGVYNHWQKSMLTDDPDEAVRVAESRGLEVEWGPDRILQTRYYISAFEYFPALDRNLLYSSIADDGHWFDAWPNVLHLPPEARPLKLTFGDGTEMTRGEKQQFVDVYDQFGMPIDWRVGDVAVICNYRFAHGRPAIHLDSGEERELGVVIGEAYDRVQDLPDKW